MANTNRNWHFVLLAIVCTSALTSADYYFGPGDPVDGNGYNGDILMADGDIYREHWPMDSGLYPGQGTGIHQWPKCIDIPHNLTLCQNLRYNQMRLPNLLEHDTVREVTQQAKSWVPLVGIRCHPDTKLFLCSLFSPVCLDRPIWPCRSLCSAVKTACERHMNAHGFDWPDMLKCDKFPLDNDLCIGLQNDMKPDDKACEPCNKPDTFESIVHNFCISDFVAKIKIGENVIVDGMTRITAVSKKKKIYKQSSWVKSQIRQPVVYLENGGNCDCRSLDDPKNDGASFIVMGKRKNGKDIVEYFQLYDRKNKNLKKAFRAIRKGHICEDGVRALTQETDNNNNNNNNKNNNKKSDGQKGNNDNNGGRNSKGNNDKRRRRRKGGQGKRDGDRNGKRNRKNGERSQNSNSARRNRDIARDISLHF